MFQQQALASALCLALASSAPAQTWVQHLDHLVQEDSLVAVSPAGQIAIVRHEGVVFGLSFLAGDGSLVREYARLDAALDDCLIDQVLFMTEDRLAIGGTLEEQAYVAVIDVDTGVSVFERVIDAYTISALAVDLQGNLLVGGKAFTTTYDPFVVAYSATGALLWTRQYRPTAIGAELTGLQVAADGDIVLQLFDDYDYLFVTRTDPAGNERWSHYYTLPTDEITRVRTCLSPDGDVLVAMTIDDGSSTGTYGAMRIGDQGVVEWANRYSMLAKGTQGVTLQCAVATPDGGLLMGIRLQDATGTPYSPGVAKLRANGSVQWVRLYGDPLVSEYAPDLAVTPDGGFAAAAGSVPGGTRIWRASAGGDAGPCAGSSSWATPTAMPIFEFPVSYHKDLFFKTQWAAPASQPMPSSVPLTMLCGLPCAPASTYCLAKPNSAGCTPQIGSSGAASPSGPGITVTAAKVVNGKKGLLFWGRQPSMLPFQGGYKCVSSPTKRTPVQDSGGSATGNDCTGSYAFTFDAAYMAFKGIAVGDTIHCQYWYRDPAATFTTGLSDALQFSVCP